ncbi:hypothetical protein EDC04DRAFT_2637428 [Pisolithus marmoratus]|nr:hypothetical protein EDC04DRAFT_2637428 [Pisolithus marmoratus]
MCCFRANPEETVDGIIALIGPPGSGRTSFMCNATGTTYRDQRNSVKCQTSKVEAGLYTDGGRKILLLDTPGIRAPFGRKEGEIHEEDVSRAVEEWLEKHRPHDRLTGILFFQQLKAKRPEVPRISCFRGLCQHDIYSSIALIGTMGDDTDLRRFENETWRNLIGKGVKSFCYQNTPQSAREAINMIYR